MILQASGHDIGPFILITAEPSALDKTWKHNRMKFIYECVRLDPTSSSLGQTHIPASSGRAPFTQDNRLPISPLQSLMRS